MAEIYAAQKKPDKAMEHWREAARLWSEMQDRRITESFWTGVQRTIEHAGPALRPEIDKLLRTYVRRNGSYRIEPFLRAIEKVSRTPAEGARWIIDLSAFAAEPSQFLASVVNSWGKSFPDREMLYAKMLELAQREAERRAGDARNDAQWRLQEYQLQYLRALVAGKQHARAAESIRLIPAELRESMRGSLIPIEIEIAAATGKLDAILARQDITTEHLRSAAASLRQAGETASARRLLEQMYTRELDANSVDASNFLGLAEVKLEQGETPAAVALLRRMTLVTDQPFETLRPAAELLSKFGRKTEANEFIEARVKAAPWDSASQAYAANLQNDVGGCEHSRPALRSDTRFAPKPLQRCPQVSVGVRGPANSTSLFLRPP